MMMERDRETAESVRKRLIDRLGETRERDNQRRGRKRTPVVMEKKLWGS